MYLELSGVENACGFSRNALHKRYLEREIVFRDGIRRAGPNGHQERARRLEGFSAAAVPRPRDQLAGLASPRRARPAVQDHDTAHPVPALGIPPTTHVDNPV